MPNHGKISNYGIKCKNQWQCSQSDLHRRVHVILSTYQLALFLSPSDLYMNLLAALPLSAMSRAVHTPPSEAHVVEQSLSLSNLGTGHNRIQRRTINWITFLKENCSSSVFRGSFFPEQHETTFFFNHSLFHYFLSDRDVNRQVDDIHKETIVQASWTMASCGLWHLHARVIW